MPVSSSILRPLSRLLTTGEAAASDLVAFERGVDLGLWSRSLDGHRVVASARLVETISALPSVDEAPAAIVSCDPEIRAAWRQIIAARLKEMGNRREAEALVAAIDTLGDASSGVREQLTSASLARTEYGELEGDILGVPAEQAVALPKLLRAIGATAALVEGGYQVAAPSLPDVDGVNPENNWLRGRMVLPPSADAPAPTGRSAILSGGWASLAPHEQIADELSERETMRWVLARPWVFLLAQLVFTQEAWSAERVFGTLALEIEPAYVDRFDLPPQILVVVTSAEGEEVICGSLGELLMRVLTGLGVTVLAHRMTAVRLDDLLVPLVRDLLRKRIWRFNHAAGGWGRPSYTIHESFSDACYRALGSKYFYRLGGRVTAMIRSRCELWAGEQIARAGSARVASGKVITMTSVENQS